MLSLFRTQKKNQAMLASPRHGYMAGRILEGIIRATYNYRRTTYFVEADHILVKILQQIGLSYKNNDKQFYAEVDMRTSRIARAVGFNDYNAKVGAAPKNSFFGKGITEFYVSVTNGYTDLIKEEGLWQEFQPVKVLSHPHDEVTFNIRNGSTTASITGTAVIAIDIPLLAIQYYKWRKWAEANLDLMPTIEQFVFQYPLVNMLPSDIQVCYFNKLSKAMVGNSTTNEKKNFTFTLPDVSRVVDEDIDYVLDHVYNAPRNMIDLSQSLMLPNNGTVWDQLQLPNIPIGSGNAGVLTLAALPWLSTLAQLSYQSKSSDNGFANKYLNERTRHLISGSYLNIEGLKQGELAKQIQTQLLPYLR